MIYIKLDESMNLCMTKREPIYRGDHLNRTITYLIPMTVGNIDMERATVYGRTASRGLASMGLLQIRMVSSASLTTSQTNSCWPAGMEDCTSANRANGI